MASTRSVRHGQIEVGIIEHNGLEYAAYGATVIRRDITAYLKYKCGHYWLTILELVATMLGLPFRGRREVLEWLVSP